MGQQSSGESGQGIVLFALVMVVLLLSMTSLALIRVGTDARLRTVKSDLQTAARCLQSASICCLYSLE